MADWVCPHDREALETGPDGLACRRCGAAFRVVNGFPLFTREAGTATDTDLDRPTVESRFAPRSLGWPHVVPAPPGAHVVQVGPGGVEDLRGARAWAERFTVLVSALSYARAAREHTCGMRAAIAVVDDAARLPLPDGCANVLVVAGVRAGDLERAAIEWGRVLGERGSLVVTAANALHRRGARAARPPRSRPTLSALRRAGFVVTGAWAPVPDARDPRALVPFRDPQVVRHFLERLVRRNSPLAALALRVAAWTTRAGAQSLLFPEYVFVLGRGRG